MARTIRNSDPQAMREIAREIRNYGESLTADVKKLADRHAGIHSEWSGEQYDRFTDVIAGVKGEVEKQAARLAEIASEVEKDALNLEKMLSGDGNR